MPRPRPLPKKCERALGAGIQTVVPELAQVLGEAASTHMLDECGVVGKIVVVGELETFTHVPLEAELLGLDPVVGNTLEGAGVLGWRGRGTRTARLVGDGGRGRREGGDEAGAVLGSLQVLFQKTPVVPF